MSFLQDDCFRTKEGERKGFQNVPRTAKVFGLAKYSFDTDTVAHGSFFVPNFILILSAISIINSIHFIRYDPSIVFLINC